VVRLGKKGCPVRLEWEEITPAVAVLFDKSVRPSHAVNPLDIQGEILSYEPLPIPPHLIFRVAEIRNDWFVFSGEHRVHLPRRFTRNGKVSSPESGPAISGSSNQSLPVHPTPGPPESESLKRWIEALPSQSRITVQEIIEKFSMERGDVRSLLATLCHRGVLTRLGKGRGVYFERADKP
jgi:hypothetical protein